MKNGTSSYFWSSMHALFDVHVQLELSVALQPGRPTTIAPEIGSTTDTLGSNLTTGEPAVSVGMYQSGWPSPSASGAPVQTYALFSSVFAHSRMRAAGAFCTFLPMIVSLPNVLAT